MNAKNVAGEYEAWPIKRCRLLRDHARVLPSNYSAKVSPALKIALTPTYPDTPESVFPLPVGEGPGVRGRHRPFSLSAALHRSMRTGKYSWASCFEAVLGSHFRVDPLPHPPPINCSGQRAHYLNELFSAYSDAGATGDEWQPSLTVTNPI
jgi:hypothetical protein